MEMERDVRTSRTLEFGAYILGSSLYKKLQWKEEKEQIW
jgi:hypothetical protein